jgi:hypothetical protein
VAISDLVLLHNKATDAQAKKDPIGIDLFDKIPDVKREFLKFCKPFEARLRSNVETHRVIAKDEEHTTDIMIPGFIIDKSTRGSKRLGALKINLQFLEHHKVQFLALHRELAKIGFSPQTDAALTNFKTIIELELGLLMGGDIDWAGASDFTDPAAAEAGHVLPAAAANDDDDNSSSENNGDGAAAAGPADNAGPPAASAASSAASAASSAASAASSAGPPAAPAGGGGHPAAPAASAPATGGAGGAGGAGEDDAPDPNDFTTWTPENWAGLDFNLFAFPADPFLSICSVRAYHAVALLLVHVPSLRTAHPRVWGELNTAWLNTFHSDLSETALEKWPTTGPLAFSTAQGDWLTETLRYLKSLKPGPALRRRSVPASPAPAAAQDASEKSQKSKAGGARGKHRRDPDPVQDTSR